MERIALPKIAYFTLTAGMLVAGPNALAHNSFTTPVSVEGTRVYNAMVISDGCGHEAPKAPVIATSIVFPDGTDSIVKIGGEVQQGSKVGDYIDWGGKISHIPNNDVFKKQNVNLGRGDLAGENVVGSHSWKGKFSTPFRGALVTTVPFRVNNGFIVAGSCAKSVTFRVAAADICKRVKESKLGEENVNLWVPAVGSKFDGDPNAHAYDGAVEYVVTRDLDANPLPGGCGEGVEVVVEPSAAQVDHDLPIPGVWPN